MRQFIFYLIEFFLFYFLIGHVVVRKFLPKRSKALHTLKEYEHFVSKTAKVNRDLLPDESILQLRSLKTCLRTVRKSRQTSMEKISESLQEAESVCERNIPSQYRKRGAIAEYLEVAVVALGIAFAVRGFALQPFKIPTGSMEPTLHGINFIPSEELEMPPKVIRGFEYLNYSRRYADATVESSGRLQSIEQTQFLLWPNVKVTIAGTAYKLPGSLESIAGADEAVNSELADICQDLVKAGRTRISLKGNAPYYEKGTVLARGYLEAGDHLFVDRFLWNFIEPERGDITVFITTGLKSPDGGELSGRYYIKRLVGLPGDELKIKDRKLYLRRPDEKKFKLVDEEFDPVFTKINEQENGYKGYTQHPQARFLTSANDVFKVPDDHYFMLGDNSPHSLDSRFWGAVPRENLVGRAALVWWPFSPRWGVAGRDYR